MPVVSHSLATVSPPKVSPDLAQCPLREKIAPIWEPLLSAYKQEGVMSICSKSQNNIFDKMQERQLLRTQSLGTRRSNAEDGSEKSEEQKAVLCWGAGKGMVGKSDRFIICSGGELTDSLLSSSYSAPSALGLPPSTQKAWWEIVCLSFIYNLWISLGIF